MKAPFTLFFILFTLTLSAQYEKGNWYLDGATNAGYGHSLNNRAFSLSAVSASSYRLGQFSTDRILVGMDISFVSVFGQSSFTGVTNLELRPFARYYFPGSEQRKVSYFGEAGFGRVGLFGGDQGFETDFHFGGGAEVSLRPGILGTASLRYNAYADGLNYTNLTLGLNVLTGQLENSGSAVSLSEGVISLRARLGAISYGRMSSNGLVDQSTIINLSPWMGYFISDRLMLEGGLGIFHQSANNEINEINVFRPEGEKTSSTSVGVNINLRYYLKKDGRLLPYLMAGGGFTFTNRSFRNDFGESSESTQTVPFRFGAGTSYFLSPYLALDAELAYERSNRISQFQIATETPSSRVGLNVGFRFFLPK